MVFASGMDERLQRGIDLFNRREFFESHEVLEQAWVEEVGARRRFLQSLIHFAVGFHHHQHGNATGAKGQLRKGIEKLAGHLPFPDGIDAASLDQDVRTALNQIDSGQKLAEYPRIQFRVNAPAELR